MAQGIHLYLVICLCLTQPIVYSEETTTSRCQPNANGAGSLDCNLNATTLSPTPKPSFITNGPQNSTENSRARAMNYTLTAQDAMIHNALATGSMMHKVPTMDFREHSIDDVSMEETNDEANLNYTGLMSTFHNMMNALPLVKNATLNTCVDNNKTYKVGEKFNRGCNETCQCVKAGEIMCGSICKPPYQVKGRNKDPSCIEVPVDGNSCCVLLNCPAVQDLEAEPIENCYHKNETYKRGSTFNDTCDVCICEAAGRVNCKSRCPRIQNTTGNCLAVQDPDDPCCKRILCDVEEHDLNKVGITASDETGISSSTTDNQILSVKALNETSVSLTFAEKTKDCNVEVSENGVDWSNTECVENTVGGLEPGKKYHFRLKNIASNKAEVTLPGLNQTLSVTCSYKGRTYKINEEFYDGCESYCVCESKGVHCANIECPTDFGLDVLDPQCLDWEIHPPDFTPTPPYCCPDKIRCKDNGSCMYNGENYPNWSELPVKATGCEKRCYCEMGNVSCTPMCAKISNTPPKDLLCPPEQAVLQKPPDDECCLHWTCPNVGRPGNETIKSETKTTKEHATNTLDTTEFTQHDINYTKTTYSTDETTKPNTIDRLTTVTYNTNKKPLTNFKNSTDKKEFYPGPFSPQYFAKNESSGEKPTKKPGQGMIADLLSPFHLEKFASEIEKNLHSNDTSSTPPVNKKPGKKPIKGYAPDEEEDEEETEDHYDEKNQYEDLFTDLFDPKSKNKNSSKHSIWNIKPPEIPPFVKNPNLPENEFKDKSTTESNKHSETAAEFPKKHIQTSGKEGNKKQKPQFEQDKPYEVKISDQTPNNFLSFPNIPYTIPENGYPNVNPHLKYPPSEILIHQAPQNPNLGFNNKYKPAPINDPNQSEEFYHLIDNDAYNDEQIRQNLHFGQHEIHPQFGHVVKLTKDGVRLQNPNEQNTQLNVEEVLTHLHHETNNNVHLPNILPGGPPRHQVPIHNFGYQNYHETLNADQTSHPLLLQPELLNQHNNTNRDEIKIHVLEAVDEHTVKLVFSVPQVLVGLHGRVELRYTSDLQNNELSTWELQILAPPDDLFATAELEFELSTLQPNTTYKIKISVVMSDVGNAPTSNILTIRTLSGALPTTLPPIILVEADLRAIEVNATYIKVSWRIFSDTELQFIDGVQLRYKELDDKIYAATPLIHRAVTTYTIEELKPNTIYEIGIYFIPFPGQSTELQAHKTIQIRTGLEFDPYKFDIMVEVHHIKASSIEISWSGVPYPEDKYVNIFRAIYQSEGSREDFSTFKVAKRDSSQNILIQDLKPGTRYRLWLEAYLTNGRSKKSNVKDFITKIGPAIPPSTSQGKLEGTPLVEANTYYGPLVAVSILATIAVTSTIILILILAKKHGTIKAPITTPINRKNNTSAAYDNQAYKVDIQHETMDL